MYSSYNSNPYGSSNPYGNSNPYGSSNTYGNSNPYGSSSPVSGYSNALDQHLSKFPSNRTPYWGSTGANQSSNQTPYGGGLVNTGDGGGSFDPSSPTPGYSSPTGNYPEPGWPEPGGAETPTYPTPSPTTPTTIPPIYSPNTPSPSGDLPPVEIISRSWTPPAIPPFIPPEILDMPEMFDIKKLKKPGAIGFYSADEGAAAWAGKGGNTPDLDLFVSEKVGGPTPIRFRDSFG